MILHRGLRAGEELLPGLRTELLAVGGISVDTGLLPWLGEHGWLPHHPSYQMVSMTRPLFEDVVRQRVAALPDVHIRWGARVVGLARNTDKLRVLVENGSEVIATLVVDATGRTSRLPTRLADIGVHTREPLTVDARLGYATQLITGGPDPHQLPGVVIQATPQSPSAASRCPSKEAAGSSPPWASVPSRSSPRPRRVRRLPGRTPRPGALRPPPQRAAGRRDRRAPADR